MIAKAVKGKGFRGALEYDLGKEQGRVIDSNMAGTTTRELAAEFGEIRKLRPNLGKAVLHVSLSAAPGEVLSDEQWRAVGAKYLRGMGFNNNQYVMTRHTDTEHEHIHILANRITHSGEVVSDGQDYKRQEIIMREVEREYGLTRVAPSQEAERKAPTKGEIEQSLRSNVPSTRQRLQQLCDAAKRDCHEFSQYQERLEAAGVELVPVAQLNGAKLSGVSYRLDGVLMKGSDLGKAYSPAGLAKEGITYEQNRDFAAVSRAIERETARAFGRPDRGSQADQTPERGGLGRDAGAVSTSDGRADGRDAPDTRTNPQGISGSTTERARSPEGNQSDMDSDSEGRERSHRAGQENQPAFEPQALRPHDAGRADYSGSRERILALVQPTNRQEQPRRGSCGPIPETRDRSLEALQRQVAALGTARFEVGIRDAKTGLMMNREWSRRELEDDKTVAWLKRMNAKGNDIYVRPAGEHGLVLVDDLKPEALKAMREQGYAPAVTLETSPNNCQAWVKMADVPLAAKVRDRASHFLASEFGGKLASNDYGRLAGFTNQWPEYGRNGQQPYVLVRSCSGMIAGEAKTTLDSICAAIDLEFDAKEKETRLQALAVASDRNQARNYDPIREYQQQAKRVLTEYGEEIDLAWMDRSIAVEMAKSGRFTQQDIERGIYECSPNIGSCKDGGFEGYAQRMAEKGWNSCAKMETGIVKNKNKDKGLEL